MVVSALPDHWSARQRSRKGTTSALGEADADAWEKACSDAYYAAEAGCLEFHQRCIEEGLNRAECDLRLQRCLSDAEYELDGCIDQGRQLRFASTELNGD